jgi:hypothetical protein
LVELYPEKDLNGATAYLGARILLELLAEDSE